MQIVIVSTASSTTGYTEFYSTSDVNGVVNVYESKDMAFSKYVTDKAEELVKRIGRLLSI